MCLYHIYIYIYVRICVALALASSCSCLARRADGAAIQPCVRDYDVAMSTLFATTASAKKLNGTIVGVTNVTPKIIPLSKTQLII